MKIGGNIDSIIQMFAVVQNDIGEDVQEWTDKITIKGWLDLCSGEANFSQFSAKIQESTHVFVCDFFELDGITAENSRMLIDGQIYEITLIDNPMNLNEHFEIFLKYLGG